MERRWRIVNFMNPLSLLCGLENRTFPLFFRSGHRENSEFSATAVNRRPEASFFAPWKLKLMELMKLPPGTLSR